MQFFIDFLFFAFFEMNSNQHIIERDDQESIFFNKKKENPELNFNDSEEFFSLENKNQLIPGILSFTQTALTFTNNKDCKSQTFANHFIKIILNS